MMSSASKVLKLSGAQGAVQGEGCDQLAKPPFGTWKIFAFKVAGGVRVYSPSGSELRR